MVEIRVGAAEVGAAVTQAVAPDLLVFHAAHHVERVAAKHRVIVERVGEHLLRAFAPAVAKLVCIAFLAQFKGGVAWPPARAAECAEIQGGHRPELKPLHYFQLAIDIAQQTHGTVIALHHLVDARRIEDGEPGHVQVARIAVSVVGNGFVNIQIIEEGRHGSRRRIQEAVAARIAAALGLGVGYGQGLPDFQAFAHAVVAVDAKRVAVQIPLFNH